MIETSIKLVAVVLLVSYLYGKIFNKFIKPLERVNCTLLGFFVILGLFQLVVYYGIPANANIIVYIRALQIIFGLSIVLVLVLRVNILPKTYDLVSLILPILFCLLLGYLSSIQTTNSAYFDSNFYLSEVLESSTATSLAHLNYYHGSFLYGIDVYHDYQGYYYFWGILINIASKFIEIPSLITPVYMWGASFLYYYSLGLICTMSLQVVYKGALKKFNVILPIFAITFLLPYYTNYFNSTLGFFGNSFRTIAIGLVALLFYCYIYGKDDKALLALTFVYLGGISLSSSTMFISAFMIAGLFFYMVYKNNTRIRDYYFLFLSSLPVFHYAYVLLTPWYIDNIKTIIVFVTVTIIVSILCYLLSKLDKKYILIITHVCKVLYLVLLIALIGLSFLLKDGMYGYGFFFESRSLNDMCLNYTSWLTNIELLRNVVLWAVLIISLIRFKSKKNFKLFLIITALICINPLTQPVISTYGTQDVYSRVFDIICNPFVLVFLFNELNTKNIFITYFLSIAVTMVSCWVSYYNCTNYYSRVLIPGDNFDYETKSDPNRLDIYEYLMTDFNEEIKDLDHRPIFVSQDIDVKAYVNNIELLYGTSDIRDALDNEDNYNNSPYKELINLFYPFRNYGEDNVPYETSVDYEQSCPVVQKYDSVEYLLIKNNIPTYSEKFGWYYPTWHNLKECSEEVYSNDEWIILKMNK